MNHDFHSSVYAFSLSKGLFFRLTFEGYFQLLI